VAVVSDSVARVDKFKIKVNTVLLTRQTTKYTFKFGSIFKHGGLGELVPGSGEYQWLDRKSVHELFTTLDTHKEYLTNDGMRDCLAAYEKQIVRLTSGPLYHSGCSAFAQGLTPLEFMLVGRKLDKKVIATPEKVKPDKLSRSEKRANYAEKQGKGGGRDGAGRGAGRGTQPPGWQPSDVGGKLPRVKGGNVAGKPCHDYHVKGKCDHATGCYYSHAALPAGHVW